MHTQTLNVRSDLKARPQHSQADWSMADKRSLRLFLAGVVVLTLSLTGWTMLKAEFSLSSTAFPGCHFVT